MTETKYKIAIIGPKDIISGFRALGADTFPADEPDEVVKTIYRLKNTESGNLHAYAIIMVTNDLLDRISPEEYAKISRGALPAVISIPNTTVGDQTGLSKLKQLAERAIGSDILS